MRLGILFFFCSVLLAEAQGLYVVKFRDKANSPFQVAQPQAFLGPRALSRRAKQQLEIRPLDLPVNPSYLDQIQALGGKIIHTSRWLNAALVQTPNASTLGSIVALSFVTGLETQGDIRSGGKLALNLPNSVQTPNFNLTQLTQLGADQMLREDITGKGILLGVFDSGFSMVHQNAAFRPVYAENRVVFTRDLVDSEADVYDDDAHGALVLSAIGGHLPDSFSGTAPGASFALFRTEDVFSETKLEEWNWLVAAEIADSLGVDIINSSLGYSTFDVAAQNYQYSDMTGQKALITRAANWAAGAGMLVVTSAGNEGRSSWRYITAPADGDSVLAVGAVNANGQLATFSSLGPSASGKIKPEVVAMGSSTQLVAPGSLLQLSNGTSFSSPLIAGFAAGVWQKYPQLTAMELRRVIMESGSLAQAPNNQQGYGLPNWQRIQEALEKVVVTQIPAEPLPDVRTWYESKFDSSPMETNLILSSGQKVWSIKSQESAWGLLVEQVRALGAPVILEVKNAARIERRKVYIP